MGVGAETRRLGCLVARTYLIWGVIGAVGCVATCQQLDELIHSRIRLAVMSILVGVDEAEFTYLRDRTGATNGNLGAHMRKLEDAGYVTASKQFVDRKPVTRYRRSEVGREAFGRYVDRLERLIGDTAGGE